METILLGVYIGEFSWEGKGYKGSDKTRELRYALELP